MGSDQGKATGPDLAEGVPYASLKEGQPLVGQREGEAVMLVRRGQELFAVSSTCTHYSGPLGEGLVVDDTVRCPWHHACFSLRTGEAVRAPALNPISCFRVERAGDLVRVGAKIAPTTAKAPPGAPDSIVIIGAGAAGNAAAEALRRRGYTGELTMIGREADTPYDRPNLSKDYLAGTAPEEWIPLRGEDFYREQKITLLRGTAVTSIDPRARTLALADGRSLGWDRLLLATGADPVKLPLAGAMFSLRTLADSRAIVAAAAPGKRAVVIGASFIGMEVAAALRARKVEVHVVAPDAVPFERVLGAGVGEFLHSIHAEHGVVFHSGETVTAVTDGSVTLAGGKTLPADFVVAGIGVRPTTELAAAAGLTIDRGVVVDEKLETSAPGIFAAGDLARWPDPRTGSLVRVEHWVLAERMGQAAALSMLGEKIRFDAVPFFWTTQYDLTLSYIGHAERWDRIDVDGRLESRDCALAYRAGGKTLAVVTVGRDQLRLEAERAMEHNDEARLQALVPQR